MYLSLDWVRIAGQGAMPFIDDRFHDKLVEEGAFMKVARHVVASQQPPPPSAAPPAAVPPPVGAPPPPAPAAAPAPTSDGPPAAAPAAANQGPAAPPPKNQPPANEQAAKPQPPSGWTAPAWMPAGAQAAADQLADDPAPFGSEEGAAEGPGPINTGTDFSASTNKISSNHGKVHVWNTGTADLVAGIVVLVVVGLMAGVAIFFHKRRMRAMARGMTFPEDGWDANAIALMVAVGRNGGIAMPPPPPPPEESTVIEGVQPVVGGRPAGTRKELPWKPASSNSAAGSHRGMIRSHRNLVEHGRLSRLNRARNLQQMSRQNNSENEADDDTDNNADRNLSPPIGDTDAAMPRMPAPAGLSRARERYYRSHMERQDRRAQLMARAGLPGGVAFQPAVLRI
ncbi:hypothetical protein ABW21_db0205806 [Orbilia brochopaga]|nr:hypothetical protein ABW21_db0205806 [Drechslerella brochopaga]